MSGLRQAGDVVRLYCGSPGPNSARAAPHWSAPKACRAPPVTPCPGWRRHAAARRADFDWAALRIVGAAVTRHSALTWRMTARLARRRIDPARRPRDGQPQGSAAISLVADRARAVMEERLIVMLITDLKA
jgi:hypothetical protein